MNFTASRSPRIYSNIMLGKSPRNAAAPGGGATTASNAAPATNNSSNSASKMMPPNVNYIVIN